MVDIAANVSGHLVQQLDDSSKHTISALRSCINESKPDLSSIRIDVHKLIEEQNPKIEAQNRQIAAQETKIDELTKLVKAIPTTGPPPPPPSFIASDRALIEMQSDGL